MDKLSATVQSIATVNWQAFAVGAVCLAVLFLWPRLDRLSSHAVLTTLARIPGSLVSLLVGVALVCGLGMNVNTIGDLYVIDGGLPQFELPHLSFDLFRDQMANGITIAILAAIESLLSCVVADSMIQLASSVQHGAGGAGRGQHRIGSVRRHSRDGRHRANRRQREKRRPPIAGMVHAVVLFLVLAFLMPYAASSPCPPSPPSCCTWRTTCRAGATSRICAARLRRARSPRF